MNEVEVAGLRAAFRFDTKVFALEVIVINATFSLMIVIDEIVTLFGSVITEPSFFPRLVLFPPILLEVRRWQR